MVATLGGGIQRPGDCLEIEFLFGRALGDQTTKTIFEPPFMIEIQGGQR
jgi:hypothetical protein